MDRSKLASLGLWCLVGVVGALAFNGGHTYTGQALLPQVDLVDVPVDQSSFENLFVEPSSRPVGSLTSDFALLGVIYSDMPAESKAILQMNGSKAKVYPLNSMLPNGAFITKIRPKQVELAHGAEVTVLELPKVKSN